MSHRENRPSPSVSATAHSVGTVKKGNDGNKWEIVATSSGTHRWLKLKMSAPTGKGKGKKMKSISVTKQKMKAMSMSKSMAMSMKSPKSMK